MGQGVVAEFSVMMSCQGGIMSRNSKKESHFDLKGAQFAGGLIDADTVNAERIGGDIINNYAQKQKTQTEANDSPVKTILILASNPKNTSPLRLDEEVREIDGGLQESGVRSQESGVRSQELGVRSQESGVRS